MAEDFIFEIEAARVLGVTRQTLARWRKGGVGPPYVQIRGSRAIRYRLSDVKQWLAGNTHNMNRGGSNMTLNMEEQQLLSEEQVAKFLNVTTRTLQTQRKNGKGPRFIQVGDEIRYRAADVEDFLFENTTGDTKSVAAKEMKLADSSGRGFPSARKKPFALDKFGDSISLPGERERLGRVSRSMRSKR